MFNYNIWTFNKKGKSLNLTKNIEWIILFKLAYNF